ncbi:O-methyltransferase [Winogradskyella ursingii]|uniref:O-methyltransferase n=1 Tax=Winogradskyella ursingii TaxID=2686079 RepID=UPI0015CB70A1|nr:class I SAM-dependent methyltransferase [Winogradskyella ursingii]
MYQVTAYIKFLLSSTNQHGVHSPFVYKFVTKCLYDRTKHPNYYKLKSYRKHLLDSNTIITVLDLGEGSKKLKKKQRSVQRMALSSSSSKKNTKLLYRVSKYFKCESILELGTSLGMATYALALSNKNSKITTIEGCANTSDFTKNRFNELRIKQAQFIKEDFSNIIPTLEENFDLIFFDGHHNKDATIKYFQSLLSNIHNDTLFVFDDIYWSKGMTEAWEYIKEHPAVTVTVDCFFLGFVFFREEQVKEHFKIRL